MSSFNNYPLQLDDQIYFKSKADLDYNLIFEYLINNSDYNTVLNTIKTNLDLGIEDPVLTKKAYDYSMILTYFNNLAIYCRKANTEEKANLYCNYISCLEKYSFCRTNPKLIRGLADLLCYVYSINKTAGCVTYSFDEFTYDLISYSNSCNIAYSTTISTVFATSGSEPTYIDQTILDVYPNKYFIYKIEGIGLSTTMASTMYKIFPPSTPQEDTSFVLEIQGDTDFGQDYTNRGALLDSSWNFNVNHKKQYITSIRKYLVRYINGEWFIDDIENVRYKNVVYYTIYYAPTTGTLPYLTLTGGTNYVFTSLSSPTDSDLVNIDNPAYNKNQYIKITSQLTINSIYLNIGIVVLPLETIELFSNGITWTKL